MMIRINEATFLELFPNDMLVQIYSYLDKNDWVALSLTNSKIKVLFDRLRLDISFRVPKNIILNDEVVKIDQKILVNLLKKFPNIKKLSLKGSDIFSFDDNTQWFLKPLIIFFKTSYPKRLEHLVLEAKNCSNLKLTKFSIIFFESLSHPQLRNINYSHSINCICGFHLASLLGKTIQLQSLSILTSNSELNFIPISNYENLQKIKLLGSSIITIKPLKLLTNLSKLTLTRALTIEQKSEFESFLCKTPNLKVSHLTLGHSTYYFNKLSFCTATKNLPHLEFINLQSSLLQSISDKELYSIGINCKKFKTLMCNFSNITDSGLIKFALTTPQLEKLSVNFGNQLTDYSLIVLAKRCKQLKSLALSGCINISNEFLCALAENCKNLELLDLTNCKIKASLEEFEIFVKSSFKLKYFTVQKYKRSDCIRLFAELYQKFPKLSIPDNADKVFRHI
jgi:hypothetical protein